MTEEDLHGKVALVTGAARGQGRSHAVRLAAAGADIVAIDLADQMSSVPYPMAKPADLDETRRQVEHVGSRCVTLRADVRDSAAVDRACQAAVDTFGRLDVAVANAGITIIAEGRATTDEQWADTIAVNLTGVFNTVRSASRRMAAQGEGGSIICIGSVCSQRAQKAIAAYVASKHGVLGLVRAFALELADARIRVNLIEPGNVDSPMINNDAMYRRLRPDLESPGREEAMAVFGGMSAMPVPWVEPTDISEAVAWLASDRSRFITGTELVIDAGLLL